MPLLFLEPLPRRAGKGEVLAHLLNSGALTKPQVGKIELRGSQAVIEIPEGLESRVLRAMDGSTWGERKVRAWIGGAAGTSSPSEDHFQRLGRLLELESRAQAQRVRENIRTVSPKRAERSGYSLVDLVITDEDVGLGSRKLITLVKRDRVPLPWSRLHVGDPVVLSPHDPEADAAHRGVISERTETSLQVALSDDPDDLDAHDVWRIDDSDDETAVQRQRAALERARLAQGERLAHLRDVLLGEHPAEFADPVETVWLNDDLNVVQRDAVTFALSAKDVALIHGPPGTGKTTTVIEIIRQAIAQGQKMLACAPSNIAVDNLFEKLWVSGARAIRLGHPARVLPELREHTLDMLVAQHPDVKVARSLVRDAWKLFRKADHWRRTKPTSDERRETRQEARALLADARRLEARAVEHLLDTADVLCATTTSLDSELLGSRRFDLVVIDEACQSTEPGCWIPLLRAERVVLAGDHCQLPPTVLSKEAASAGFKLSLFERLMDHDGPTLSRRLTVQYRMHQDVMAFSSREFYDDALIADESVREHRLTDLVDSLGEVLTDQPVEFIDTAGAGYDEEQEPEGDSRLNPAEAALAARLVRELLEAGLPAEDIAVIAPYAAQVRLLEDLLPIAGLEIDTVDGFQGREKEAVVFSLVRSNSDNEVGFLSDTRRMNVALTRAKRKRIVIGDSATLASHPFYARMIDDHQSRGGYRTVWELPEE